MTTLADLITPLTPDNVRAQLIALLQEDGFGATAWQPATVPREMLEQESITLAQVTVTIADIAKGGFLDDATGPWLTLLAKQVFDIDRDLATPTQRTCNLTLAGGSGPYTFAPGDITATTAAGKQFTNITGGTLSSITTPLALTFQAVEPGTSYNVGTGAIDQLVTSFAGVTIVDPGSPAVNVIGTDDESDPSLVGRCRDLWGTLGAGANAAAFRTWVRAASSEITKASVTANNSAGTVSIVVASDAGAPSNGAVTAAQTYVDDRQPLCVVATVTKATVIPVVVTGTVYVSAAQSTVAQAAASDAIAALNKSSPVGGAALDNTGDLGLAAELVRSAIAGALGGGVLNIAGLMFAVNGGGAAPAADVALTAGQIAVVNVGGLTWTAV